jgi:hypothetical protein
LTDCIIATAELVEAEGRALRRSSLRVCMVCGVAGLALALAAAGLGILLWSFYEALPARIGTPAAGVLTGLLALLIAGLCGWLARVISR